MSQGGWMKRRHLLQRAMKREGGRCFWCNEQVSWSARMYLSENHEMARHHMAATLDHIVPKSQGGKDVYANVVCSCYGCNARRLDMDAAKFLASAIAANSNSSVQ